MATATTLPTAEATRTPTLADILTDDIPAARVVLVPTPGTATFDDAEAILLREKRLCELVDGILVEKAMGWYESSLACALIRLIGNHVAPGKLGIVTGEGGTVRLAPQLVRIPDVAFVSRARFPGGKRPDRPIPALVPDLAVEVLSESNTRGEMERKLRDYFAAGILLVWYLDPKRRIVSVYTGVNQVTHLDEAGTLDGGSVLPGFSLKVGDWFEAAE